jgi:hypothetical protein
MPWIESHTEIERHRKTILMAAELGIKRVYLSGHLHCLWHHILEQQEDGDLTNWPPELIAQMAEYDTGDVVQFFSLLKKYSWINEKNNLVHDWLDYAGRYLTAKYRTRNPGKLKAIFKLHGVRPGSVQRRSKVRPGTDNPSGYLGNISSLNLSSLNLKKGGVGGNAEALPDWIDPEVWQNFAAMRQDTRHPLKPNSQKRIVEELGRIRQAGGDANASLKVSTLNEWRSVYPEKQGGKGLSRIEQAQEAAAKRTREIINRGLK